MKVFFVAVALAAVMALILPTQAWAIFPSPPLTANFNATNETQIQQQIQLLMQHLDQIKASNAEKQREKEALLLAPIQKQDHLNRCATDQHTPTNWKTYLVHFACGHVQVFGNGTVLRKFMLVIDDYNGTGTPIPITKNLTDPVIWHAWTVNGSVPGPTMRMTQGDHVSITVVNSNQSVFLHSIHMHSIHSGFNDGVMQGGNSGGMIFPGSSFTYNFVAQPAGLYVWHCHMSPIQEHISRGLYGMLVIDPIKPRPPAAEMVMMMNAFPFSETGYNGTLHFHAVTPGTAQEMRDNLSAVEDNSQDSSGCPGSADGCDNQIYAVNSMAFGYTGNDSIPLTTGIPYRIYLANMVEFDVVNSFHLHGGMFFYTPAGTLNSSRIYTDIVTLGQADRGILEFTYKYPGEFMFHSHIAHFSDLGWTGFFNVTLPTDHESAGFINAQGFGAEPGSTTIPAAQTTTVGIITHSPSLSKLAGGQPSPQEVPKK